MAAVQRYATVNLKIAEKIFVLIDVSQGASWTLPTIACERILSVVHPV